MGQGRLFDGRIDNFPSASCWFIWTSHDGDDLIASGQELAWCGLCNKGFECWDREVRSSHIDNTEHGFSSFPHSFGSDIIACLSLLDKMETLTSRALYEPYERSEGEKR